MLGSLGKMARKLGNIRKSEVMRVYGKKGKSAIRVPRQVSLTINHTFVNLGKTGHNMAEILGITTVWTTKARGQN